jgi:carbamoyl-phosphate synthase large subunit
VYDSDDLDRYMREAVRVSPDHPVLIDDFLEGAVEIDCDAVSDGTDVLIGAIMEHIEEAGIHSGDSACVIPPQSLSPDIMDTVRDYVTRIALALNVRGLMNIQLAAKDGIVYVLEANPRSSRTIPFVSKAVGIPLAKIAAKVIVGRTLQELGYVDEPVPQCVSVKEVLLPFDKLPGADPILGPEMRSTGEVMGMDYDYGTAYYKAQLAADNRLPTEGTVFLSIRDADKGLIVDIARKLRSTGLRLIGTGGTVRVLKDHGVSAIQIKKVSEGSPNVVDLIRGGKVDLIVNTPRSKQGRRDGYEIRRAAVDFSVPYITTIQAAVAAGDAITVAARAEGGVGVAAVLEYHEG